MVIVVKVLGFEGFGLASHGPISMHFASIAFGLCWASVLPSVAVMPIVCAVEFAQQLQAFAKQCPRGMLLSQHEVLIIHSAQPELVKHVQMKAFLIYRQSKGNHGINIIQ